MQQDQSITLSEQVAVYHNRLISRADFLQHVALLHAQLPEHRYAINLCENRYHFLVAFVACQQKQQINLLPSNRAGKEIERLGHIYQDSYPLGDELLEGICQQSGDEQHATDYIEIDTEQTVAIVFTSGSTGMPNANPKTWGQLVASAQRVQQRFGFSASQQHAVIATVPAQHMFGFEMSIVYPLICGMCIHAGRPFYPLDIQQALAETPAPRILITTPLHLNACNSIDHNWPDIDMVISATAPMPKDIAEQNERNLNTPVYDLYGCSEVGAIATRRLAQSEDWQLLRDYKIDTTKQLTRLRAPGYAHAISLPDQIDVLDDCHFRLLGRNSDLIKLAGKRGSLSDLSHKLKNMAGVEDAVFIQPDEVEGKRTRLAALVVAPQLDIELIRNELVQHIDAVFMPRPLIAVTRLPYNESGKLSRKELLAILTHYSNKSLYQESA